MGEKIVFPATSKRNFNSWTPPETENTLAIRQKRAFIYTFRANFVSGNSMAGQMTSVPHLAPVSRVEDVSRGSIFSLNLRAGPQGRQNQVKMGVRSILVMDDDSQHSMRQRGTCGSLTKSSVASLAKWFMHTIEKINTLYLKKTAAKLLNGWLLNNILKEKC